MHVAETGCMFLLFGVYAGVLFSHTLSLSLVASVPLSFCLFSSFSFFFEEALKR